MYTKLETVIQVLEHCFSFRSGSFPKNGFIFFTVSSNFGIKLEVAMFLFVTLHTGKVSHLNEPFVAFLTLLYQVFKALSPLNQKPFSSYLSQVFLH